MIIWSGLGFLVIVIVIACEVATSMVATQLTGNPDYLQLHGWVIGLGLLASAVVCWLLGNYLSNAGARTLIDPQTGGQVVYRRRHSLFFIPMRWWGVLLVLGGIAACFVNQTPEELQQQRADRAAKQEARRLQQGQRP